jgi:hypothetical protein
MTSALWIVAIAAVLTLGVVPLGAETDDDIPHVVRRAITDRLEAHVRKLVAQEDARGYHHRRGSFSHDFERIDENTYQTSLIEDTAGEDQIKVERFLATISKGAGGWEITDKELKDTWDGLYRSVVGDEEFFEFDGVEFEREGLTIRGGRGHLSRDFFMGEPAGWLLVTEDLSTHYEPPPGAGVGKREAWEIWKEISPEYTDFKPVAVAVNCDRESCEELWTAMLKNPRPIEKSQAGEKLLSLYEKEHVKETKDALKDDGFAGFRRPPLPGHRTWSVAIKKSGEDVWGWLAYSNRSIHEIHVGISTPTGSGAISSYFDKATRESGVDPYDLERRLEGFARTIDLHEVKGEVEMAVRDPESIQGDIHYVLELKEDREVIPFFLSQPRARGSARRAAKNPSLLIDILEDGEGRELTWVRVGRSGGYIVLPEETPAGSTLELHIAYDSRDTIDKLNPTFSWVPRGGWLPLVDLSDLIETFEITVRVPSRYRALGPGTKISEKVEGSLHVSHWKNQFPLTFPTVIFGDYHEDTPKIKATRADGTEIPVHVYVDKTAATQITTVKTVDDIRDYYVDIAAGRFGVRTSQLRPLADQAVNALNLYREVYGVEYPYGKLTLVNSPYMAGEGQSPCSMVYLSSDSFRGEGELALLYNGHTRFFKTLVAHEVGHQWWGGLFNNLNQYNYWFIESLAEYSSALWMEAVHSDGGKNPEKGYKEYLEQVEEWRRVVLEWGGTTGSVQEADMHVSPAEVGNYRQALIYNKGPYAFHMMRQMMGFEKMQEFFLAMGREFTGKLIVTRDIERLAEETFGRPMGWFFDQWIRGAGLPQYRFTYEVVAAEDGTWIVQGEVEQRIIVGVGSHEKIIDGAAYLAIVPITVTGKDGQEYTQPVYVREANAPFAFKVPVEPREVELNKYGETLARDTLVNRPWGG